MDLQQKLKEQGWFTTAEGLDKLPANVDKSDTRKVVQSLLDIDLRDVGAGALPAEISRKEESVAGRIVLQVVKIRNISAPKANEESKTAPRFLYLELTDGVTQIFALEFEYISSVSLNTPPGTKIFLKSDRVPLMQGILVLRPSDVQILGGQVAVLVEKWELARTLQKYAKGGRINTGSSGPPPWIPFGQKIQQLSDDKNFKSLGSSNGPEKEKDTKENEFDVMRNEAIAEAAKSGAKKVFGGGNQQMLDHNVKKIIEKGFSEIDAKNALRTTRNNLERALYNLKRRDDVRERPESKDSIPRGVGKRGTFKETKKSSGKEDSIAAPAKPVGNVSLFDFLTDKLPANTESSTATTTSTTTMSSNNKFERPSNKYESFSKPYANANQSQQNSGSYNQSSQNSIPNNQQSTSTSSNSQQSSSKPTKFENNISSSFANRSSTHNPFMDNGDGCRNRSRYDREDPRNQPRSGRGGSHTSYGQGRGGANNVSNRNQTRPSQERDRGFSNYQGTFGNSESRDNRTDGYRGNDNRQLKTSTSVKYGNKPSNSAQPISNNNRNYSENRNIQSADSDNKMMELVEVTVKMKIENKSSSRGGASNRMQRSHSNLQQQSGQKQSHQQQHQLNTTQSQQQAPVQVVSQTHAVYTPLPNGFAYDPNKIMGFQNKESNEYALSMLKTQSLPPTATAMQPSQSPAHPQFAQQAPPPMQLAPQQSFHTGPHQFLMQPPQHVRTFGIPTMDGSGFNWKIGDRCLAKYWDDGRFYEAEITGLSDKTCVVLFLGYGNYEEVLRSDCLPITGNHTIVQHHQQQQMQHPNATRSGTNPNNMHGVRYRGERQMYVPPAKREV